MMYRFIADNKEWIFSGAGIAIIGGVLSMLFKRKKREQGIESGDSSTNIQAGDGANIVVGGTTERKEQDTPPIERASLEDIEKYDPKTRRIMADARRTMDREFRSYRMDMPMHRLSPLMALVALVFWIGAFFLVVKLIGWIISLL